MKFCPECGSHLPMGIVKSCSNCGTSLWANTTSETNIAAAAQQPTEYALLQPPVSSVDDLRKEDEIKEFQNQTIYSIAIKLEKTIEQILKNMEYSTETETKLIGNSCATHEADMLAKLQNNKVPAVEYKNYREARLVEIKKPPVPLISPKLIANVLGLIDISL
jgi:uncharacterized membrane protein YvbJ